MLRIIIFLFTIISFEVTAQITSVASGNWTTPAIWSGGVVPGSNDDVVINHGVTLRNATVSAHSVIIRNTATSLARLEIQSAGVLNVSDDVTVENTSSNSDSELYLNVNGIINIGGSLTITRNQTFTSFVRLRMTGASSLTVQRHFTYNYNDRLTTGETQNEMTIGNNATTDACKIQVGGDFNLTVDSNSINNLSVIVANKSQIQVGGNMNFSSHNAAAGGGGGRNEFFLSNDATLSITGNLNMILDDADAITSQQGNYLYLRDASALTVNNINMSSYYASGHRNNTIFLNPAPAAPSATSTATINGDITFIASSRTSPQENAINANSSTTINMKGKVLTPAEGSLEFSGSTLFRINGTGEQNLASANYANLEINNLSNIAIASTGPVGVKGALNLVTGIIETTLVNYLKLESSATTNEGNASSFIAGPVQKVLGTTTDFTFPTGKGTAWSPMRLYNIAGNATTTVVQAEYFNYGYNTDVRVTGMNIQRAEYWTLGVTGQSLSNGTVRLGWSDACFSGVDLSGTNGDFVIASLNASTNKFAGLTTTVESGSSGCDAMSAVAQTGRASATGFLNGSTNYVFTFGEQSTALPVTWLDFSGFDDGNAIQLEWTTASEYLNNFFEVTHSADGMNFKTVGKVLQQEGSGEPRRYTFTHTNPLTGRNYYRLIQHDLNGDMSTGKIIAVMFEGSQKKSLTVYPNPIVSSDAAKIGLPISATDVMIVLTDSSGKLISTQVYGGIETNEVEIKAEDLYSGSYIVWVRAGNAQFTTHLLVNKQK